MADRVFLALWDHKHGQDMSAHTSEQGAFNQCVQWARGTVEDWEGFADGATFYYTELSDKELFSSWSDITGHTEFLTVEVLDVVGDN
jgi:hypothetical protein